MCHWNRWSSWQNDLRHLQTCALPLEDSPASLLAPIPLLHGQCARYWQIFDEWNDVTRDELPIQTLKTTEFFADTVSVIAKYCSLLIATWKHSTHSFHEAVSNNFYGITKNLAIATYQTHWTHSWTMQVAIDCITNKPQIINYKMTDWSISSEIRPCINVKKKWVARNHIWPRWMVCGIMLRNSRQMELSLSHNLSLKMKKDFYWQCGVII